MAFSDPTPLEEAVACLKHDTCPLKLDLSGHHIGDDGATPLAEALGGNMYLQTLNLANNNIGPDGVAALTTALKGTCVRELILDNNPIGDAGATALAALLEGLTALQMLGVQVCGIGPAGATALTNASTMA
jgi:Ran GTPase-activating protein (RanGAP) involved in mRNA processing and transport